MVVGMELTPLARRRARYLVPLGAAVVTAGIVIVPQAASGAQHPNLPARTAAQLLASLEQAKLPQFSGTTVETARLGLPSINDNQLPAGMTPSGQSQLSQLVTLLTGSHTAQIAYAGPTKQRVAIFLSDLSETDIVHNGSDVWTYSSESNTVTHSTVKQSTEKSSAPDATAPVNPTKAAEQALAKINPSTRVTVDRTAKVAGRAAYQVDLNPRDARSLISSVRIALDSKTSMPLRVQIWSRHNSKSPAFSVGFTSLSMSAPSASTFDFSKPPSATLAPAPFSGGGFSQSPLHTAGHAAHAVTQAADRPGMKTVGKDWTTVLVAKTQDGGTSSALVPPRAVVVPPTANATTKAQAAKQATGSGGQGLSQMLDEFGTQVSAGHIITTSLATILITNDNRILIGAVTPQYIEQVAASKAAQ